MSRVKIEIDEDSEFDLEDGDMIIHIKYDGDIGKICMPDMNPKVKNSTGYKKMLEVLDLLKPGTKNEFIKYHERQRKGSVH